MWEGNGGTPSTPASHRRTITLIGKESNRLEERSRGEPLTAGDLDERITTYDDHDEWYRGLLPDLREFGVKGVAENIGMSQRRVRDLSGRVLPRKGHRAMLVFLVRSQVGEESHDIEGLR